MTIRRIINAPIRFFRYLGLPGREMQARYDALTEDEKAELRYSGMKQLGHRVFPSPGRTRQKDRP